jgi:hypothetical protein
MEKIKKAYSWLSDKLWPIVGSLSEELIILVVAALFSSSGYGLVTMWLCIWGFIAIIRIAVYGEAIQDKLEQ